MINEGVKLKLALTVKKNCKENRTGSVLHADIIVHICKLRQDPHQLQEKCAAAISMGVCEQ